MIDKDASHAILQFIVKHGPQEDRPEACELLLAAGDYWNVNWVWLYGPKKYAEQAAAELDKRRK